MQILIKKNYDCNLVVDKAVLTQLVFFTKNISKPPINDLTQKKSRKKWSTIFLLLNVVIIAIVLWTQLKSDGGIYPLSSILKHEIKGQYLLFALLCFAICMLFESFNFDLFIKNLTHKSNLVLSYKTYAMGKYYDLITPFSIGGQPYMTYYLSKRGFKTSEALSVVGAKYVSQTITFCLLSLLVMCGGLASKIFLQSGITANLVFVKTLAWVGIAINLFLVLVLITVSINKHFMNKIIIALVWFLAKIKIVKNKEVFYIKISNSVLSYQQSMKRFFKNKTLAFCSLIIKFAVNIAHYSISFFVFCAFSSFDISLWVPFVSAGIMIDLAANSLPIPGGTGISEMSFTAFFSCMFAEGTTFWALMLWRILTYYVYILQGFIIMIYDFCIGNKKLSKQIKK